jgi:hypothetical protein
MANLHQETENSQQAPEGGESFLWCAIMTGQEKRNQQRKDTSLLDSENIAEIARLELQGHLLTLGTGGIVSEWGNSLPDAWIEQREKE